MHNESSVLARPVLAITARIVSVFVPQALLAKSLSSLNSGPACSLTQFSSV